MNAVAERIDAVRAQGRAALIGYLPVGYPDVPRSIAYLEALVEGGCDLVEVGVPYSDPVLDGPIIQRAAEGALEAGVRVSDVFAAVRAVAEAGAVPVPMTYYNPMLQYGLERFATDLATAGGGGVITPDLTPDVAEDWIAAAEAHGLAHVFLVAPSSTAQRLDMTVKASTGFVYATAVMGVTGERASLGEAAEVLTRRTREAGAERICVGVGVATGEQAARVAQYADGVIVGSALVRCLVDAKDDASGLAALRDKVAELAAGVRGNA